MRERWGWIHPLLLSIYPILLLYSENQEQLTLSYLIRPLGASVAIALLFYIVSLAIARDGSRAALLASGASFLFFSFGWFSWALDAILTHPVPRDPLLAAYLLILAVFAWGVSRSHLGFARANQVVTVFAIVLVTLVGFRIASYEMGRATAETTCLALPTSEADPDTAPDIYYIVLDRYASAEVLADIYGFDNSEFVAKLQELGFYVDGASRANYAATAFSLAATLNMQYLSQMDRESDDWTPMYRMMRDSCVVRLLKSTGYTYVHFGSGWGPTRIDAEASMNVPVTSLTELEDLLLSVTALAPLDIVPNPYNGRAKYRLIEGQFDRLPAIARLPEPTFTFAHMLVPHPPFVFQANGDFRTEAEAALSSRDENYLEQIVYTNKKLLSLVRELIRSSKVAPIIVIQADEGPYPDRYVADNKGFDWTTATREELYQKMGILSAYYIKEVPDGVLHEGMTPVNTFRLIFKYQFGCPCRLLEDRSYVYRDARHPYELIDVTEQLQH